MSALALFAVVSVAAILMRGRDAVGLYQASVALPSGAILPLALAAGLAIGPRRAGRIAALPICLVGLMIGVAGSGTFLHAFGRDPFLVAGEPLAVESVTGSPFVDFKLAGMLTGVSLSPHGQRVALVKYPAGMRYASGFFVGKPGSEFTSIAATDLLFLDDERALAMSVDGTRTRLQEIVLGSDAVTWERWIDDLSGRLVHRRSANRWVVTGTDADGRVTTVEGVVGRAEMTRRRWNETDREGAGDAWATNGDIALRAQRTFGLDPLASGALTLTMAAMLDQMQTRLTRMTPGGQSEVAVSRLETFCTDRALEGERLVCTAYDGARTHVLTFAPTGDAPEPIGSVSGRFFASRPASEGWLTGWTMSTTAAVNMPAQMAIDVGRRRIVAFPRELRAEEVTVAGQVAAVLTHDASSTRIRLYRLER